MAMVTAVKTLGASAVQLFPGAPASGVRKVRVEPLRSNTHVSYVGDSTVTNDASGTGVIQELAQPPAATVAADYFEDRASGGHNSVDATVYYGHGTTGEKLLCTYWTL